MRQPCVDDLVCLIQSVPEHNLRQGDVGVVRSTWFAPSCAYEVEFRQIGSDYPPVRALLTSGQIRFVDGSAL